MRTIWKFELVADHDEYEIEIPMGAVFLSVGRQGPQNVYLWAEVDTEAARRKVPISVRGTGNPLTGGEGTFIGTVLDEPYVWHVYAKPNGHWRLPR